MKNLLTYLLIISQVSLCWSSAVLSEISLSPNTESVGELSADLEVSGFNNFLDTCECDLDQQAPQITGEPLLWTNQCIGELSPTLEVTDDCDPEPSLSFVSDTLSNQYCSFSPVTSEPCLYTAPWNIVLFNLPVEYRYYETIDMGIRYYDGGIIHLYGSAFLTTNPNAILHVDAWFEGSMTWTEWSNQEFPTSFKADCEAVDNHEDWIYYIMTSGSLTGEGDLSGTNIQLEHAPINHHYAFQLGQGANNVDPSFGFGGWFTCDGPFVNAANNFVVDYNGTGDFAAELSCCNSPEIEFSYSAEDNCGHVSQFVQIVEIHDEEAPVLTNLPPSNLPETCLASVEVWNAEWTENCSPYSTEISEIVEEGVYTSIQTAMDACGNTSTVSFSQDINENLCGCTEVDACNFNELAILDDGTCEYISCSGCIDTQACNYDEGATIDDGSCHFFVAAANAGADQYISAAGVYTLSLTALPVVDPAFGTWSTNSPFILISDINNPSAVLTFLTPAYVDALLVWTVFDPICNITLTDTVHHSMTGCNMTGSASAGSNLVGICQGDTIAVVGSTANFPVTSLWTVASGSANILNPTDQIAYVTNLGLGDNELQYTINRSACGGGISSDLNIVNVIECIYGCTNPNATNYNPLATHDDGSCLVPGCTDTEASNYNPEATVNQGCLYFTGIIVFNDLNEDGQHQTNEPGLQNWPLYIAALGATVFTNEFGTIDLELPASPYVVTLINNSTDWNNTSPLSQLVVLPNAPVAEFGLIPISSGGSVSTALVDTYWDVLHCTDGYEAGLIIENTGSNVLHGNITLTCDPLFTPGPDVFSTIPPNAFASGFAQWSIEDYLPGSYETFSFHVDGPGEELIGNTFPFSFQLILLDENDEVVFEGNFIENPIVSCSYDPNDLIPDPIGYSAPHYILAGDRIEFRVRFQNVGNVVATDVLIVDDIDETVFDITTFEPLYGSDTFTGCLHDDGMLDFVFNDINLAPSNEDEEGSHGYVVFAINTLVDLEPGTVLYNEAFIHFDDNAPIVTNEVFHTIYDCDWISGITGDTLMCEGDVFELSADQSYVESFAWSINGPVISTDPTSEIEGLTDGEYLVSVQMTNPLCDVTREQIILVAPIPALNAGDDIEICEGESFVLDALGEGAILWDNGFINGNSYTPFVSEVLTANTQTEFGCVNSDDLNIVVNPNPTPTVNVTNGILNAIDGEIWQWYFNGDEIQDATSQSYTPIQNGDYQVMIWNEFNCSVMSAVVVFTGIELFSTSAIRIYPNPMNEEAILELPRAGANVFLLDGMGREINSWKNGDKLIHIERNNLANGIYMIRIVEGAQSIALPLILN